MSLQTITSQSNSVCKQIISLQQRKNRRATGLFVLEGVRGVKDALEAGWIPIFFVVSDHFLKQGDNDYVLKNMTKMNTIVII